MECTYLSKIHMSQIYKLMSSTTAPIITSDVNTKFLKTKFPSIVRVRPNVCTRQLGLLLI